MTAKASGNDKAMLEALELAGGVQIGYFTYTFSTVPSLYLIILTPGTGAES